MSVLESLVGKNQVEFVIKLLKQTRDNNLKDNICLIIIKGGPNSGKTVLTSIFKKLAKSTSNTAVKVRDQLRFPKDLIKDLIIVGEFNNKDNISKLLSLYIELVNGGFVTRAIFDALGVHSPGTFLVRLDQSTEYKYPSVKQIDSWSRKECQKTIYGGLGIENKVNFLDDFVEKTPRYPVEIKLPFCFSNEIDPEILVDAVLKELVHY